jgi:hypothetical protein
METPPPAKDLSAGHVMPAVKFAKTKKAAEPFEDWEDPIWTYHHPNKKIWMSRIEATFYRSAGLHKPEELPMLDGKLLTIKETKTIKKAKQAYVDQMERLNDKKNVRAKPYDHRSKYYVWHRLLETIPELIKEGNTEQVKAVQQEADAIKAAYELQRKEELKKAPIMADQFGRASAIANSI